jgi:HTH domain
MAKSARVLALLEALQDHPSMTGPRLASRLGVDVRTVRRDIFSLQDLGPSPSSSPAARGPCCGCAPSPLDWVAGLLAVAGCAFTIRRPDGLRRSVRALADRLHTA